MTKKKKRIEIGDTVLIEQAWEDEAGHYHDEHAVVSHILPDGQLKFQVGGHWKSRKARDQKLQAWLNQQEWFSNDVTALQPKDQYIAECIRCNDNGCPACDGTKGSQYNPEPF